MGLIKSVSDSDQEILTAILSLHIKSDRFDLDPCFSRGKIYEGMNEPRLKFDYAMIPERKDVRQADVRTLLEILTSKERSQIRSICFDPPFMFGVHGKTYANKMNRRFTMFQDFGQLEDMYKSALSIFFELLPIDGILAFKCQDYTDTKTIMTHCFVWEWATQVGFYPKDLFIKIATGGRIYNPKLIQRHSRKYHCYWWVFEKCRKEVCNGSK
jgi:hypothetical protein